MYNNVMLNTTTRRFPRTLLEAFKEPSIEEQFMQKVLTCKINIAKVTIMNKLVKLLWN